MNAKTKKILKRVWDGFLWVFLLFALAMTILSFSALANNSGCPKFGKTCILSVLTDSMNADSEYEIKGFKAGDLLLGRALTDEEKANLEVGQIITYFMDIPDDDTNEKRLNTHRIVGVKKNDMGMVISYETKGDNVLVADPDPVFPTDVQAVYEGRKIAGFGKVIGFLQSGTGFLVCIVLPLAAFFVYEIVYLVQTVNRIKNKGKKQITEEEEELIKQRAVEEYLKKQAQQQAQADASDNAPKDE